MRAHRRAGMRRAERAKEKERREARRRRRSDSHSIRPQHRYTMTALRYGEKVASSASLRKKDSERLAAAATVVVVDTIHSAYVQNGFLI